MGFGDALMATAQARELANHTSLKVAFGDGVKVRWGGPEQEVFQGNPRLATQDYVDQGHEVFWVENYSGHRPYIDRDRMVENFRALFPQDKFTMKRRLDKLPWRFTDWRARDVGPGEIYLTPNERWEARHWADKRFAVIEPGTKSGASPNKQWSSARYQEVARRLGMSFIQFNPEHGPLPDAVPVRTPSFRTACAILSHAAIYIGTEGGLHHAAAALGVPAVVYHGGYISPDTTGYEGQIALYRDNCSPCGQRVNCPHCRAIADEITADEALDAIRSILDGRDTAREIHRGDLVSGA